MADTLVSEIENRVELSDGNVFIIHRICLVWPKVRCEIFQAINRCKGSRMRRFQVHAAIVIDFAAFRSYVVVGKFSKRHFRAKYTTGEGVVCYAAKRGRSEHIGDAAGSAAKKIFIEQLPPIGGGRFTVVKNSCRRTRACTFMEYSCVFAKTNIIISKEIRFLRVLFSLASSQRSFSRYPVVMDKK